MRAINDAPAVTPPAGQSTAKETKLDVPAITVADIDATNMTVTISIPDASKATLSVPDSSGATVTANNSDSVMVAGTLAQITTELAGVDYTPNTTFVGSDTITVAANDGGETGFNTAPFDIGTDSENIVVTITGTSLDTWRIDKFTLAELQNAALEATVWGNSASPDKDVWKNIYEFIFGIEPKTFDLTPQVTQGTNGAFATFSFKKRIDLTGITGVKVQVSASRTGPFVDIVKVPSTAASDPGFEIITYEDDVATAVEAARSAKVVAQE